MSRTQASIDSLATVTPKTIQTSSTTTTTTTTTTTATVEANVPVPNILDLPYIPTVLMRYPKQGYVPSQPFPPYVAMVNYSLFFSISLNMYIYIYLIHN